MRILTPYHLATAALVAVSIACAESHSNPAPQPPIQKAAPSLRVVAVPGLDSLAPASTRRGIAVASTGHLAIHTDDTTSGQAIAIVAPDGKVVARMGTAGRRRGQLAGFTFMRFDEPDNDLVVFDVTSRSVSRFGIDGRPRGVTVAIDVGYPVRIAGDSVDMLSMHATDFHATGIIRVSANTGRARVVVSQTNEAFRRLGGGGLGMAAASTPDVFVLALQRSFELQSFNRDGSARHTWKRNPFRTPAEVDSLLGSVQSSSRSATDSVSARERLLRETRDIFSAIQFDDNNRLWAFGNRASGDAFADIFSDTTFLGTTVIPCKLALFELSIRGDWVAARCASATAGGKPIITLFRMAD